MAEGHRGAGRSGRAANVALGLLSGLAVLAAAGGDARAEPTAHAVAGYLYAVGDAETVHEVGELALRRSSMVAAFAADDPSSALHLATFTCSFVSHTTTDASVRHQDRVGAAGACLVTDRDGDTHVAEWQRPPGAELGTWTVVRGTGKWREATGTGTYDILFLSPPPKPQLRFTLTGEIATP